MNYEKITKTQARKMHAKGETVFCLPLNAYPGYPWVMMGKIPPNHDFDKYVNEYSFYFYGMNYLGKRIAFYKEESQFEPRQRTAVDGKVWWVVYDKSSQQYSTLLCFGRYKTKKACENAIRLQKGGQQND